MTTGESPQIAAQGLEQAIRLAVGVTTCPRQGACYLPDTLASLSSAGFPNPRIFDDVDKELGAYGNARRALRGLLDSDSDADGILIFQDDVIAARGLAGYLERTLWPDGAERIGAVSLFTPAPQQLVGALWHLADLAKNPTVTGGLALVLPARAARRLQDTPPRRGSMHGWDISVRAMCVRDGLDWWYHSPSLIRHIGESSSIATWPRDWPARQCAAFFADVRELKT